MPFGVTQGIFAAMFLGAGTIGLLKGRKSPSLRAAYVGLLVVGAIFVAWALLSELVMLATSQRFRDVRQPDSAALRAIVIHPHSLSDVTPQLVTRPVRIDNGQDVARIADLLTTARRWSVDGPHMIWQCRLVLEYGDRESSCDVLHTTNNGTCFDVVLSSGRGRLLTNILVPSFRQDALGELLSRLAFRSEGTGPGPERE